VSNRHTVVYETLPPQPSGVAVGAASRREAAPSGVEFKLKDLSTSSGLRKHKAREYLKVLKYSSDKAELILACQKMDSDNRNSWGQLLRDCKYDSILTVKICCYVNSGCMLLIFSFPPSPRGPP
jgi:hypothetical protein